MSEDLIYKISKTKSDIEKILADNKRLVYYMLREKGQLNNQDAESAAWEALWDAVNTFDVFSNTKFSTYACSVIGNAIGDVLRKQAVENKKQAKTISQYTIDLIYTDDGWIANIESSTSNIFEQSFNVYIKTCTGMKRNILLTWNAAGFDIAASNIAKICCCSPSYVCRVQDGFRSYLTTQRNCLDL